VRWLDPESRSPHEESGRIEAADLDGSLREADEGLQLTATAAYFADGLRAAAPVGYSSERYDPRLPATPSLGELAVQSHALPSRDRQVRDLTEAIDRAARLADDARTSDGESPADRARGEVRG